MDRVINVVLDIQCFKDNDNGFIIKEISAVVVDTGVLLFHHIVCPPYDRRLLSADKLRENNWLTKHFHGLEWHQGDISYVDLLQKLKITLALTSLVFVKGKEKADFIATILPQHFIVIDLESLHCQSLSTLNTLFLQDTMKCCNHKASDHKCALTNSLNLRKWYLLTQK